MISICKSPAEVQGSLQLTWPCLLLWKQHMNRELLDRLDLVLFASSYQTQKERWRPSWAGRRMCWLRPNPPSRERLALVEPQRHGFASRPGGSEFARTWCLNGVPGIFASYLLGWSSRRQSKAGKAPRRDPPQVRRSPALFTLNKLTWPVLLLQRGIY